LLPARLHVTRAPLFFELKWKYFFDFTLFLGVPRGIFPEKMAPVIEELAELHSFHSFWPSNWHTCAQNKQHKKQTNETPIRDCFFLAQGLQNELSRLGFEFVITVHWVKVGAQARTRVIYFLQWCELCFTHVTVFQYHVSVDP
jgi:hypothetical protein